QNVIDNGERREGEEVHFQQAHLFDVGHRIHRRDFILVRLIERYELGDGLRGNYDSRSVRRGMTRESFQTLRDLNQFSNPRIILNKILQIRILRHGLVERDVQLRRYHLRDLIDLRIRHLHAAARVLDHTASGHRSESDDLGHIFPTVFFRDVVDNGCSTVHAEIDVDIRQRDAFGVQEALEEKSILKRIDICNAHAIRNETARRRSATWTNRNVVLASIADEIPNDQEIPRILHTLNNFDLLLEPHFVFRNRVLQYAAVGQRVEIGEAVLETIANNFRKIGVDRKSRWNDELRKWIFDLLQLQAAPLCDLHCLIEHLRNFAEHTVHLFTCFEIELIGVELHAIRIVHCLAGLDAQQNIVRAAIVLTHVVTVVRGNDSNAGPLADAQHVWDDLSLLFQTVIVNFEKETIFSENILILRCCLLSLFNPTAQNVCGYLAIEAS